MVARSATAMYTGVRIPVRPIMFFIIFDLFYSLLRPLEAYWIIGIALIAYSLDLQVLRFCIYTFNFDSLLKVLAFFIFNFSVFLFLKYSSEA